MNLYRFKTFRTSYYFPDVPKGCEFLYGLYTPFGSKLAKAYWWTFRHIPFVRIINKVDTACLDFPFDRIISMCPEGSIISLNMGTPGPEQKISMLGLYEGGEHFFAKYSTKEAAMALSRNEIFVLQSLKGKGLAPELLSSKDTGDGVFFATTCVEGCNPVDINLNDKVIELAININRVNFKDGMGLSHGDFTPWNVIVGADGTYHMIDWEMAKVRKLGYDIFTYITHVATLLSSADSIDKSIETNKRHIDRYFESFDIRDWHEYLVDYVKDRVAYEISKGHQEYAQKLEVLLK